MKTYFMGEIADMLVEAAMNDGWVQDDNGSFRIDPETGEFLEDGPRRKKKKKAA